ncbi:unnamed protein product [Thlaspi arvense]|uniref:J domain-containing protein n=1 Tax=Thlaspi arvense TaxID=13288 RepID=A0AAU9S5V4_THLAR|nr:unnamed protein product [Thlaspi arvense]
MSINRDEALRAKDLAEDLMKKTDFTAARKLALKANKMDPSLENISRMTMVCDVHCAATENSFGNEMDWYGILQVDLNANDIAIKKQYKRLALLLHPDKNKLPGAESAFKLIGEAQRMLLDRDKRMTHDMKRRTWRKPAPSYNRPQQVPSYQTQRASVNIRNIYSENRHHPQQQTAQAQPAAFSHHPTFWTSCPLCRSSFEYGREHINREMTCRTCTKQFTAIESPFQSVPLAKRSSQTTSFPQQNKFPSQKAGNEPEKRPVNPATVSSRKASFPTRSTAVNNNGKRRRNNMVECSDSSDSETSSDSDDVVNDVARDLKSNGGQQPRRSVRSKRQVSYNENLIDDDVDLANDNGEGSGKNIDTEREEESEDEKQTHEDHRSTETLPNGINPKEKVKEDEVESSAGDSDPEEDLISGSAAKPNIINCDDPEFFVFDKQREESCFEVGQIWALYDEGEAMPRFYARIKKVTTRNFSLKYVWLEAEEDEEDETRNLPVSVGNYELGNEETTNECNMFSHLVRGKTRSNARRIKVFPEKGETWALYKNWNIDSSSDSDPPREYEFVEILSDYAEQTPISVAFLSKVKGFSFVFCPMPKDGSGTSEIPPHEFRRFSHRIPSFRLTGKEGRCVCEGWFELDPAALPARYSQNASGEGTAQNQDHQSPPSGSAC